MDLLRDIWKTGHCGDIERPSQDGGMSGRPALFGNQSNYRQVLKGNNLGRKDFRGDYDNRLREGQTRPARRDGKLRP